MLVLKRKVGETIMIGDQIEVQVLAVEGETVKLGFTAPTHVQILRKEIYDSIRQENQVAGQKTLDAKELASLLKDLEIKPNQDEVG
jgi:carbon storage regulator